MVRTKADGGGRKAVAAKAPRKQVGGSSDSAGSMMSPSKNAGACTGGNVMRVWPKPDWQKGVQDFFSKVDIDKNSTPATQTEQNSSESSTTTSSSDIEQPGVSTKELGIDNLESDD